jgi:hypothetical protein
MKKLTMFTASCLIALAGLLSEASLWAHGEESAKALAKSAGDLIAALDQESKAKTVFPFDAKDQSSWHFFPDRMLGKNHRKGLPLMAMNARQKEMADNLLRALLTSDAFSELEDVRIIHGLHGDWDAPDNPRHRYYVCIFGNPSTKKSWGFSFEGHHLSLNCTLVGGRHFSVTPSFWGAGPVVVSKGPHKGIETFRKERQFSIKLVNSLSEGQKKRASMDKGRGPGTSSRLNAKSYLPQVGIKYADLDRGQQRVLLELVRAFAHKYRPDIVRQIKERKKIEDFSTMTFAYLHGSDKYVRHFRVQTKEYLIEFDNPGDKHVHSAWRDFDGDFGRDLIAEHLDKVH